MSKKSVTDSLDATILQIVENEKPDNISQLIALLKEQIQISEAQALNKIVDLENRGKIKLGNKPLPPSFKLSAYLQNSQARWYWITTIFTLLTLIVVFVVPENMQPWIYMRNILGAIFVLYLPGYTFVKTLFPTKPPFKVSGKNLDRIERFALSVGFSLVILPLFGVFFDYVIGGVGLVPVFFSLLAFSMIFASTALVREYQAKINPQIL